MRQNYIIFILLFICSIQSAFSSLASKSTRWDKPNVIVCWANWNETSNFEWISKTSYIRSIIENEFNEKTPVRFLGWKPCADTRYADAIVSFDFRETTSSSARASIGIGNYPDHNGLYSYVYLDSKKNTTPQEMLELRQTALHEFGHLAGLIHEHIRVEAKNDSNCMKFGNHDRVGTEKMQDTISWLKVGGYDSQSIMNYCFNEFMNHQGLEASLSLGDIKTLEALYSDFF